MTRDDDLVRPRDIDDGMGRPTGGETNPKPSTPKPTSAPPSQRSAPPPSKPTDGKESK